MNDYYYKRAPIILLERIFCVSAEHFYSILKEDTFKLNIVK